MPSGLARWSRIPARWSRLARTTQLACGSLHTHTTATFWPHNLALNANPRKLSRMHGTPFRDADFSEPHPPHTAATPTAAKAGLHSPRHDHLAGQSRVKTPPPRPLPRREVAVGMSYTLLWPPSEPTFSQTGSLRKCGWKIESLRWLMLHAHRTSVVQAPECTTCLLWFQDLTTPRAARRRRAARRERGTDRSAFSTDR